MAAELRPGSFIIRCPLCHRLWVAAPSGRTTQRDEHGRQVEGLYGLCAARLSSGAGCKGRFIRPTGEIAEVLQASLVMGSWEAVTALVRENPEVRKWCWYNGGPIDGRWDDCQEI